MNLRAYIQAKHAERIRRRKIEGEVSMLLEYGSANWAPDRAEYRRLRSLLNK